ncbi:MAG: hypothetical protein VXZ82_02265 [Planctomycetota bacterium]|nr:hypothetical protein [Planctomycetota bacterium]
MWHSGLLIKINNPLQRVLSILLVGIASSGIAQDFSFEPQLKLAGPDGQLVYVIVRYHNANQPARTVHMRLRVGQQPQSLEFGHASTRVIVFVPCKQPVTATLLDGEDVLAQTTAADNTCGEMQHGDVEDSYEPPRFELNGQELGYATGFLSGIAKAELRSSVADSGLENIQPQTLQAYCTALNKHLGKLKSGPEPEGWFSWEGKLGTRIVAGASEFEKGSCEFKLVFSQGKLLDVLVSSEQMPDDWFQGPSDPQGFAKRAEELVRLMFSQESDSSEQAQMFFEGSYRKNITVQQIQQLQKKLQEKYGPEIQTIQHLDSFLAPFVPDAKHRSWDLYHLVVLGGEQCIAQTTFDFSSRSNFVGNGKLASINFRPSWPSVAPQQAKLVEEFLTNCYQGEINLSWFHPSLKDLCDEEKLQSRLEQIADRFEHWSVPELATWSADRQGEYSYARGKLRTNQGPVDAQFDFIGDQLLGVTLLSQEAAWSTLDCIRDPSATGRVAHAFWSRIFTGDFYEAHSKLQEEFKEQLPRQRLEQAVSDSDFSARSLRRLKVYDQVFTQRVDRSFPATVSVYLVASFRDGSPQTLRCELVQAQGKWKIVDFSSDFEARLIGVSDLPQLKRLLETLQQGDASNLIEMMAPRLRDTVELPLLEAFFTHLSSIEEFSASDLENKQPQRNLLEYFGGRRFESGEGQLSRRNSQAKLKATFEFEELVGLAITDPQIADWSSSIGSQHFSQRAETVIYDWLKTGESALLPHLSFELHARETSGPRKAELSAIAGGWTLSIGSVETVKTQRVQISCKQTAEVLLDLKFTNGNAKLRVSFQFDIFSSRIADIEIID